MKTPLEVGFNSTTKRYFFVFNNQNFFFDEIRAIEKVPDGCFLHFFNQDKPLSLDKEQTLKLWIRISDFLETDPEGEPWQ